ncbi:uncharacterized protein Bfra_006463 [Botrytis fragariae]|uniref:Uncharacterized protein n=1 Tax=Botrytis fragariae TaxID=1964551 RepID=A0A8H6EP22_9HELO|nr:uncharacterized protein Bfra_006463 [Botrytis fragariae]KAF5879258.1 hypothetical protein Bfra_006463 [Botrytis fragariae]
MPQNSENASSGMPSPYGNPVAIKHQQKANPDLPDHCYQVFQKSLLEHEYHHEEAFVSASLTRLHHGVYDAGKRLSLYGPPPHNVTFVAVTFVFHPMHSIEYRFKRAQISIQAFKTIGEKTTNQPLKIIKFAPHIAFGRYSTENLHWTFSLGATLGVSTPATATVTPSTEYDRSKVIGNMLKIQGSTRSAEGMQSSKLVWSLEENEQQCTGLPREFTFVFLVEQPVAKAPFSLQIGIKPVFSNSLKACSFGTEITKKSDILSDEVGQMFSSSPYAFNFATMLGQFEDLVELPGNASSIQDYIGSSVPGATPPSS